MIKVRNIFYNSVENIKWHSSLNSFDQIFWQFVEAKDSTCSWELRYRSWDSQLIQHKWLGKYTDNEQGSLTYIMYDIKVFH